MWALCAARERRFFEKGRYVAFAQVSDFVPPARRVRTSLSELVPGTNPDT